MSLPSNQELVKQIRSILVKAYDDGTVAEHSKRRIREMLTEHFGVDLEPIKKEINKMTQEQNEEEQDVRAQASTSRSASPVKAAKPTKATKASLAKSPAKDQPAKKTTKKTSGSGSKRKQLDSEDDVVVVDDDDGTGEDDYKEAAASGAATFSTTISSDLGDAEQPSDQFSELEEDLSTSRVHQKKATKAAATKKSAPSSSSSGSRRKSTSTTAGGSEAEQRLTRLKKLVSECGVRKQWKKLYEAAGVSETDFGGQCTVVQGVLKDLGMTGKGSIEQARKIREEREFADELAALHENTVLDSGNRTRKTRGSATGKSEKVSRKVIALSDDDDDDDEDDDESDFEGGPSKRSRSRVSDSDAESQDDGPTRRKSFKSSLASFAAGLNSDSD
ncbi:hypothetical protein EX895_004270 [Sporisorium graminicola]|uniref:DEK-C domain-containing protein n=1 Tax=Sporisorium graminicola TaxID=280036 RepID=A0A4U7KQF0_9BASI|nr:hypothetical protein EX895_004270 [Sporisorium graminicola]TKY86631.1 hypothetical protein EX895_004270 [Sporisorium graminicola]